MTTTASPTHVVWIDRALVKRMEIGADARVHNTWSKDIHRKGRSYSRYLAESLKVRGDKIEIRGPAHWICDMAEFCGDARAALEIGRQLQAE